MNKAETKRPSKLPAKKPKYSVPDEVLDQLADLFQSWGIRENDWTLLTENALQRNGYQVIDGYKPHEIDLAIRRRAIPWRIAPGSWTSLPPRGSRYLQQYTQFQKSTRCTPDLWVFPFGPWTIRQIRESIWYVLPSARRIQIQTPKTIIEAHLTHLLDPILGPESYERIPKWRSEVTKILSIAKRKKDHAIIVACQKCLKTINHINTRQRTRKHQRNRRNIVQSSSFSLLSLKGMIIGEGRICGKVRIIQNEKQFSSFKRGEILLAEDTNPVYLPLVKKAKAIITDRGGLTSHAATLAREFGIPAVIGTRVATKVLKTGDRVEVDTKRGIVRKLKK